MREIAHVTDRVTGNGKDFVVIDFIEHELVTRFFDVLQARVKRVTPALEVRLDEKRLCRRSPVLRSCAQTNELDQFASWPNERL